MSIGTASECYREPTCSGKARLAATPAAEAERAGKAQGKIKETGTPWRRFLGKPLSAHCFPGAEVAPCFPGRGAVLTVNALKSLGYLWHRAPFLARKPPLISGRIDERR
jgi:hypothetical protein